MSRPASGAAAAAQQAAAQQVVAGLSARQQHVAVAESLTGGLLAAALASVPGASVVFRGGIVAYATDLKASLLGVDQAVLDRCGAVSGETAQAMADGVRARLGATFGVATTGVAGPDPAEGKPVGTVYIAATGGDSGPGTRQTGHRDDRIIRRLDLAGNRNDIRGQTVTEALALLLVLMREETR
ncbi:MAG TPA: CinA family protein [Streptosporangiaceae bacterium]